jgi:6-phosphogluconate dehydrogenase
MQLGMVGLGRMGGNISRRLMKAGHTVVVYDRNRKAIDDLAKENATPAAALEDFAKKLDAPRAVWVMLPAGHATEETVLALSEILSEGDTVIDGGNSFWKDDIRRAKLLKVKGIHYIDCGEKAMVDRLDPIFKALAPGLGTIDRTPGFNGDPRAEQGYIHAGPNGAGHFVKMVHNGIEYGLMQAYAEGFDILQGRAHKDLPEDERFDLNLPNIAEVWRRGSVIASWLLDLSSIALAKDPQLSAFKGDVDDSGEGRWTINAAIEEAVSANVLSAALYARFRSRVEHNFGEKLLSAMRAQFGGHVEGALESHGLADKPKT